VIVDDEGSHGYHQVFIGFGHLVKDIFFLFSFYIYFNDVPNLVDRNSSEIGVASGSALEG
jgi:hypothetical protein